MSSVIKGTVLAVGLLTVAAAANAQNYGYTGTAYPYYGYTYQAYPNYYYPYDYRSYGYYPTYGSYMGNPYPAPLAFWDPYVGYRPYSDNAGPKASGHGSH